MWYDWGMKQAGLRRGAVAVHPGVALTLMVFLGLMAWGLVVNWFAIDPRVMGNQGLREKAVGSTISVSLSILGITGGVAAAAYFVFGKSMQAANIALMVLLILGSGLAGRRVYMLYDKIEQRAQKAAGNGANRTNADTGGNGVSGGSSPYIVPRPATPQPQPFNATPTPSGGTQPSVGSPASVAPAMPVAPPPPPAPAFNGKPVLDTLRAEYAAKCEALAVKAEAAYAAAAKPKKVNQFLNDSIEMFTALKAEAEVLEAELQELNFRGGREALEKAGAPLGDAARQAMAFDEEFNTFRRQVACGELSRFAEKAAELYMIIKDNFAKVQIDSKGEVTSKERAVETELFHVRTRVKSAVERKEETLKKVRGKE